MQVLNPSLPPAQPADRSPRTYRLRKPQAEHVIQAAGLELCLLLTACGGGGGGGGSGGTSSGSSNAGSEGVARNTHCAR